jgi:hypothetical protein
MVMEENELSGSGKDLAAPPSKKLSGQQVFGTTSLRAGILKNNLFRYSHLFAKKI